MVAHLWWTSATDIHEGGKGWKNNNIVPWHGKALWDALASGETADSAQISLQAGLLQLFKNSKHKGSTEDINPAPYNFQSVF